MRLKKFKGITLEIIINKDLLENEYHCSSKAPSKSESEGKAGEIFRFN